MIVSILRETLVDALQCVRKVPPRGTSLPILKNVAIATDNGSLSLTMTDLDTAIQVRIESAQILLPGAICVPADLIAQVVAELPAASEIEMEVKDYLLNVSVAGSGFRSRVAGADICEFPAMPVIEGVSATVDKGSLLRMISSVGICISHDLSRLPLTGICVTRDRRHARAVATDGHRLSRLDVRNWRFAEESEAGEWIIPVAALKAAGGMCMDDAPIQVVLSEGAIYMQTIPSGVMSAHVFAKTVGGPYPNWKPVIRPSSPHRVAFRRDELASALRRAIAVAKGPSPRIVVRSSESRAGAVISSYGPEGMEREGTEIVCARYETEGLPPEWSCNPVYLEEIVSLCPTPDVLVELADSPLRAVHIFPTGDVLDQFFLLMPLRSEV